MLAHGYPHREEFRPLDGGVLRGGSQRWRHDQELVPRTSGRFCEKLKHHVAFGRSARSQTKVGETKVRLFAGGDSWHEVMPWQEATRRRPSKPTCQSWSWQTLPREYDARRSSSSSHRQPSSSWTGARQGCFPAIDLLLNSDLGQEGPSVAIWRSYEASPSAVVLHIAHRGPGRRMRHEAVNSVVACGELSGPVRPDQGREAARRRGTGLRHQARHHYRDGGCEVAVRRLQPGARCAPSHRVLAVLRPRHL